MPGIRGGAEASGLRHLIWLFYPLRPLTLLKERWGILGWGIYFSGQLTANSLGVRSCPDLPCKFGNHYNFGIALASCQLYGFFGAFGRSQVW
jgi:hypothetical protein